MRMRDGQFGVDVRADGGSWYSAVVLPCRTGTWGTWAQAEAAAGRLRATGVPYRMVRILPDDRRQPISEPADL